jgi:hypothetical protein
MSSDMNLPGDPEVFALPLSTYILAMKITPDISGERVTYVLVSVLARPRTAQE